MNKLQHHLVHHATRGFGDSPDNCPVCAHDHPDLAARLTVLEKATAAAPAVSSGSVWARIALGAATSVVAAYVIDRFVHRKV